jgi:hypothetical protein
MKNSFFQNLTRKLGFLKKKPIKIKRKLIFNFEKTHLDSYVKFYADSLIRVKIMKKLFF